MGIQYLKSFVRQHFTGWKREEIRGNLVIDGLNLLYNFYTFDCLHGGQFTEYREKVFSYYEHLQQCGITPIVIIDGIDYTGEKSDTILSRKKGIFKALESLSQLDTSVTVVPSLCRDVYIQTLSELNIKYIVVDGDADMTLAEVANFYNCPVLSDDSDFYLFKLREGFIPLGKFYCSTNRITADVYYYKEFCHQFGFRSECIRLILPALVGNDFLPRIIDNKNFRRFICQRVKLEDVECHPLLPIIRYLYLFYTLDSFMEKICLFEQLDDIEKIMLEVNCIESKDMYDTDKTMAFENISTVTNLSKWNGENLPPWVIENFRKHTISGLCICMLVVGWYILDAFIDDITQETCTHKSLQIRKYIYGILGHDPVIECFRGKQCLSSQIILPYTSINSYPLPYVEHIPSLCVHEKEYLLYSILGCDQCVFKNLENCWKLVLATTVFWFKKSHPLHQQVKSLLLCFLVCSKWNRSLSNEFVVDEDFLGSPVWRKNIQRFAEWQSCYRDAMCLNQLLQSPLSATSPGLLYDGKILMYFATMPCDLDHLVSILSIDSDLYRKLLEIVLSSPTS